MTKEELENVALESTRTNANADLQPSPSDSERAAKVHCIAPFLLCVLVAPCLAATIDITLQSTP